MQISPSKIFTIVILSSLLGIIVNALSSRGIPLVYEKQDIPWGSDSLVNMILDTEKPKRDTSGAEEIGKPLSGAEENKTPFNSNSGNDKIEKEDPEEPKEVLNEPLKINLETAFNLYNKNILFIDARPIEEFTEGHISGAYSMPYYEKDIEQRLNTLDEEQPVVVYCSGTDCDLSIMLGNKMLKMGFKKVFVFFGGWNEWLEKNYPIETQE